MSADSTSKTMGVVLGICLVCSVLVSSAAVYLKNIQDQNRKLDKLKNILIAGDLLKKDTDIEKTFTENVKSALVELKSGNIIPKEKYTALIDPETFDIKKVAGDATYGQKIDPAKDKAGIKKMPKVMTIYEVMSDGQIEKYIFPIYGKGLWSTMYGFIAVDKDLKTVKGFTFYSHGETPGLGGEVDNPNWKSQWNGKQVYDENWQVRLTVIKGKVDKNSSDAKYQIDGLSGATLTTRGVDHLVKFWLGENGYGTYLKKLREENLNG